MKDRIYFDHNATTATDANIVSEMATYLSLPLNPSSTHSFGREAKALVDKARKKILDSVYAEKAKIVFTASGTEANNLVINSFDGYNIFVSSIEHSSIIKAGKNLQLIPVDSNGIVRVDALRNLLKNSGTRNLVSVMTANNETGAIQNIKDIIKVCRDYGALFHTDAVQAYGKIELDFNGNDIDLMSLSAHKSGGMQGVGALIYKKSINVKPQIIGGGQEYGIRSGTENVAAIIAFGKVAANIPDRVIEFQKIAELRNILEQGIKKTSKTITIFSKNVDRLANTTYFAVKGLSRESLLMSFDVENIAVSAGSACSSGTTKTSHVLTSMGFAADHANAAIRVSLGLTNNIDEVNRFIEVWNKIYQRITANKNSNKKIAVA